MRFTEFKGEYPEFENRIIFCTTIESNIDDKVSKAPSPAERRDGIIATKRMFPKAQISVTIEPIMDFDLPEFVEMIAAIEPDFVSIGADSKKSHLIEPSPVKLKALINQLSKFTRIERKTNLDRILTNG